MALITLQLLSNPTSANEPHLTPSLLLRLPYDILHLIFHSLSHAPSQICFLLTCKTLLLTLSPGSATTSDWAPNPLPLTLSTTSPKYAGHLPLRVFDVPALLHQLSPSFPSHLRLCAHCLTHRPFGSPADTDYWPLVRGCGRVANFWIQKTGWEFYGGGWNKIVHDICEFTCPSTGGIGVIYASRMRQHYLRTCQVLHGTETSPLLYLVLVTARVSPKSNIRQVLTATAIAPSPTSGTVTAAQHSVGLVT